MLAELIKRVGEPWCSSHADEFGLEAAESVADFHNNGGLEFHDNGWNYALQYAAVIDGRVEIGAWCWEDGEDFDRDATFEVYVEAAFSAGELDGIYKRIVEIYENNESN